MSENPIGDECKLSPELAARLDKLMDSLKCSYAIIQDLGLKENDSICGEQVRKIREILGKL